MSISCRYKLLLRVCVCVCVYCYKANHVTDITVHRITN